MTGAPLSRSNPRQVVGRSFKATRLKAAEANLQAASAALDIARTPSPADDGRISSTRGRDAGRIDSRADRPPAQTIWVHEAVLSRYELDYLGR